VNKAEGWRQIYRAQSGSVECGAYPATRPVYETTSPPCLFHVENTNCSVCQSVGTASLYNTVKLSEFNFSIVVLCILLQFTFISPTHALV